MFKHSNAYRFYGDVILQIPSLNYYLNKIKKGNFYFIKINHAFWDMLAAEGSAIKAYRCLFDKKLLKEVIKIIKNIDETNIILAVNPMGGPMDSPQDIVDAERRSVIAGIAIKKLIPNNYIPHHAGIWKIESRKNDLLNFFDYIRNHSVVVVGMEHLSEIKNTCNLVDFKHYKLSLRSSEQKNRHKVLSDLIDLCQDSKQKIMLFQAGDLFSTWLIYNMVQSKKINNCSLIDMGRSLDMYCPNRTLTENDAKFAKKIGLLKDFPYQP